MAFTAYDVPPSLLIQHLAEKLEKEFSEYIKMPDWARFCKTGTHRERPPTQKNWWFLRAASILYQVYMRGPIGLNKLRNLYGGRKDRGARPEEKRRAAAKIIRTILQQLEKAGLVEKTPHGRRISPKGQSLLDKLAGEIAKKLNLIPP